MWFKKCQYISIKDRPASNADCAEKKYGLFSPLVQLSGPRRGRSWKQPRGFLIQKGSETKRAPLIDLSSLFRSLVYGISFLVFVIGNIFKNPGGGDQYNGGQA